MSKKLAREDCTLCILHLLCASMRRCVHQGKPTELQQKVIALVAEHGETFAYHLLVYRCTIYDALASAPYDMERIPFAEKEYHRAKEAIAYYEEKHNV